MTQPRAQTAPMVASMVPADRRCRPGPRRTRPCFVATATVALISAAACSENVNPNPGGTGNVQPPVVQDPRVCSAGGNSQWINTGATVVTSTNTNTAGTTVINPCPYVIRGVNNSLDLGIVATIPKAASNLVGVPIATVNVLDVYRKVAITRPFNGRFATADAIDASRYRLELVDDSLYPGNYLNPANTAQMYDSIDVLIDNLNSGQAHGYRRMPGNIDPYKTSVSGPSQLATGVGTVYSARTGYPVSAYVYRWSVDGVPVSTGPSSTFSLEWDAPGTHVVSVIAYRNDRTADTARVTTKIVTCGGSVPC